MFCSCLSKRRDEQSDLRFREQFERIKSIYPGTAYVCLVNTETGDLIAQSEEPAVNPEELTRTIVALKRAAMQFAATLNQVESQVVHVKGDDRMFSCYGSDRTILAFYTDMPGIDLEAFDCSEGDRVVELINSECCRIIHSSHLARRLSQ